MHFCNRIEGRVDDGELMSETEPRVVMFLLNRNRECRFVERHNTFRFRVAGRREQIKALLSVEAAVLSNYIVQLIIIIYLKPSTIPDAASSQLLMPTMRIEITMEFNQELRILSRSHSKQLRGADRVIQLGVWIASHDFLDRCSQNLEGVGRCISGECDSTEVWDVEVIARRCGWTCWTNMLGKED